MISSEIFLHQNPYATENGTSPFYQPEFMWYGTPLKIDSKTPLAVSSHDGMLMLLEGTITTLSRRESNNNLYTTGSFATTGHIFGTEWLSDPNQELIVSASDVKVSCIPLAVGTELFKTSAEFRALCLTSEFSRVDKTSRLIDAALDMTMRERLILFLEANQSNGIVNLNHQQIAERLGTYREVATDLLGNLKRTGYLIPSKKSGVIFLAPDSTKIALKLLNEKFEASD